MKKAMMLLPPENRDRIYSAEVMSEIRKLTELTDCCELVGKLEALRPALAEAEIVLSGWGMMELDREFLDAAPRLAAGDDVRFLTDVARTLKGGVGRLVTVPLKASVSRMPLRSSVEPMERSISTRALA